MTSMMAIKEYFSKDSRKVENKELLELKKATTVEQWNEMGKSCAEALGQKWEPQG